MCIELELRFDGMPGVKNDLAGAGWTSLCLSTHGGIYPSASMAGVSELHCGNILEIVPSIHATWKEWKALYPDSLLKKRGAFRSAYEDYNRDSGRAGILGRRIKDKRLPARERIVGVRSEDGTMAFPEKRLREACLVQATVGTLPVVLVAPAEGLAIVTFVRRAGDRTLTFRLDEGTPPALVDVENREPLAWPTARPSTDR